MRADKRTGKNITRVGTDLETAMEIKAVAEDKQHGWNPCKEDNGGCSHLCFYRVQDYICACPDDPDPRPCSTGNNFLLTIKSFKLTLLTFKFNSVPVIDIHIAPPLK